MICPKCGNPADLKKEDRISLCSTCGPLKILTEDELIEDYLTMFKRAIDMNMIEGELILDIVDTADYVSDELIKKVIDLYKSRHQSDLILGLISLEEKSNRKVFVWTKERFCSDF